MSLIQWNIRGLRSNFEQVRTLFRDNNASAICLQETMLGIDSINFGYQYSFYRSSTPPGLCAQGGPGIGAGIIVSNLLNHQSLNLASVLQACAIQIFSTKWITLCSLYLEYNLENRLRDEYGNPRQLELQDLQSLIDQLPQPFILMGDFNARHRLWGSDICNRWGNIV